MRAQVHLQTPHHHSDSFGIRWEQNYILGA